MSHETSVCAGVGPDDVAISPFTARCTCGWKGYPFKTAKDAREEARLHERAMIDAGGFYRLRRP